MSSPQTKTGAVGILGLQAGEDVKSAASLAMAPGTAPVFPSSLRPDLSPEQRHADYLLCAVKEHQANLAYEVEGLLLMSEVLASH